MSGELFIHPHDVAYYGYDEAKRRAEAKLSPPTPVSRCEEVEAVLHREKTENLPIETYHDLARTLADEVDALRADLLALGKKAARYENEREINAGLVADRDAIIDKLLAMLEPGEKPNHMDPKYNPSKMPPLTEYNLDCMWHGMRKQAHARACELAGRVK